MLGNMKQSKLSELLSQLRLERCESVYEMAQVLGMSTQDLIALERDNKIPPHKFVEKIIKCNYKLDIKRLNILIKEDNRIRRKLKL
jgi:transcriptional regulator with XRE-family HTH domain